MRCVWFARFRIADGTADGGIRNSEDREKTRKCYASNLSPDSDTVQYLKKNKEVVPYDLPTHAQ